MLNSTYTKIYCRTNYEPLHERYTLQMSATYAKIMTELTMVSGGISAMEVC
jgi:hypothetical protein